MLVKQREKRWRYVVWRQLISYLHPNAAIAPSDRVQNSNNRDISKPSGDTHKILKMSYYRVVAATKFSDLQKKMQLSLRKQTKEHKIVNCFIAYF